MRVETTDGGVRFAVLVVPGASRDQIVGPHGDALRVRVAAPPEKGRANAALTTLLSGLLGVRKSTVRVAAGHASRRKSIEVDGVDEPSLRAALGI